MKQGKGRECENKRKKTRQSCKRGPGDGSGASAPLTLPLTLPPGTSGGALSLKQSLAVNAFTSTS